MIFSSLAALKVFKNDNFQLATDKNDISILVMIQFQRKSPDFRLSTTRSFFLWTHYELIIYFMFRFKVKAGYVS